MKKITTLGLIILLALGASLVVYAASNVANTKHNLSTSTGLANRLYRVSTGTNADQVCVFCHTPHSASTTVQPLWNRVYTAGAFNMYNVTVSGTMDMTVGTQPGPTSLACLSCHDGTTAFDSLLNFPGSGSVTPTDWVWNTTNKITNATPATYMGTDLSNDHPIAVTYNTGSDTAFNAAVNGKVGNLPLYGGSQNQVECGSCHNPHDNTNGTFLRASNTGSALCTTCHIK